MHKNANFNIVQAHGNCNPLFVVIAGQRAPGGYPVTGAVTVSKPMTRDEAITLADRLQAERDQLVASGDTAGAVAMANRLYGNL